jgi:hypothetical protein
VRFPLILDLNAYMPSSSSSSSSTNDNTTTNNTTTEPPPPPPPPSTNTKGEAGGGGGGGVEAREREGKEPVLPRVPDLVDAEGNVAPEQLAEEAAAVCACVCVVCWGMGGWGGGLSCMGEESGG